MPVDLVRDDDRPHVAQLALATEGPTLLTPEPLEELRSAVETVPESVSVLAIGAPDAPPAGDATDGLSAGLDLAWAVGQGEEGGRSFLRALYHAIEAIRELEAIVVASCGAYALGGGFELALGADFRIATAEASLGLPEIDVGLPTVVQGGLLVRHVGLQRAVELVCLGTVLSGVEAHADGLINDAPPREDYPGAVRSLVADLAAKRPRLLSAQKRVIGEWRSNGLERGMAETVDLGASCFGTDDARALMRAFLEGEG